MARTAGKGEFEMFYKRVWHRESFRSLSSDARLLYLWTWTNPDTAMSGLYECSPRRLERALDEREIVPRAELRRRVAAALLELAAKPLVLYDDDAEVLWVVGRVEHTLRSPTQAVRMIREWRACPPSPLKDRFEAKYKEVLGASAASARGGGKA